MDTSKILAELRNERDRLNQAIAAIEAITADGTKPGRKSATAAPLRRRRHMSAAARRKLSAMMKARWAARKKAKTS